MLSMTNVNGKAGFYACDNAAARRHETSFSTLTTTYIYDSIGKLMIQAGSDASRNFSCVDDIHDFAADNGTGKVM